MNELNLFLFSTKKEIIKYLNYIKYTFKESINYFNKFKLVLGVVLWCISFISVLLIFIEFIELKDFNSVTGFIPSSLENVFLMVSSWYLSQRLVERIIVKV